MSEVRDILDYARLLDQADMLDPHLLVERAHWNECLIREAIDRNLTAYFFANRGVLTRGRGPRIGAALDIALGMIVQADAMTASDASRGGVSSSVPRLE